MGYFKRILPILISLIVVAPAAMAETDYSKYQPSAQADTLAIFKIDKDRWAVTVLQDGRRSELFCPASQVKAVNNSVIVGDEITIDSDGIKTRDDTISVDKIGSVLAESAGGGAISLVFLGRQTGRAGEPQRSRKDRLSFLRVVEIGKSDFVRGSVVAFTGDVDVYGEVNQDVVAIFGDIHVYPEAVVRGDVIAINGAVKLDNDASVYGTVRAGGKESSAHRHRTRHWKTREGNIDVVGEFAYNRVDGLRLMAGLKFEHRDSLIPSFEALGGYAFASERGRYRFSVTQTILRGAAPVQAGGQVFRLLKSDDDKIISDGENSIFALVVNEDWKDYYEAEGAYGFVNVSHDRWGKFEIGYLAEQQNWLPAHPRLWSLFGAKDFRGNFSSVPFPMLQSAMADFDDKQVTSLVVKATVDTRDDEKHPQQGWYGFAAYENSPGSWKGEFDFRRFEMQIRRYQPLNRYLSLHLLGAYGRVGGDGIPLNRRFFLGGLGTIHGYRHKSFMGNEYFCFSGEYRFRIPRTDVIPFLQFDGGKIGADRISGNDSWYSAIALGVAFDPSLKVFVAKRLDQADADPIFYARFSAWTF